MNAKQKKLFQNLTLTELKVRERNIWKAWGARSDRLQIAEIKAQDNALDKFQKTTEYKQAMKDLKFHYETYHYLNKLIDHKLQQGDSQSNETNA